MKRLAFLPVAIVVIVAMLLVACQAPPTPTPEEVITLRITYGHQPPTNTKVMSGMWFGDEVERRTNGRVKFEHYDSSSMCTGKEALDFIQSGMADLGHIITPYYPTELYLHGALGCYTVPFCIDDGWVWLDIMRQMRKECPELDEEMAAFNTKFLFGESNGPYLFEARMPIRTVEDLKGKKVIWNGEYPGVHLEALDAVQTVMQTNERYTALQTGLADVSVLTISVTYPFRVYEVAPHATITGLGENYSTSTVINLDVWNSLPADIQQIILEVGAEAEEWFVEERDKGTAAKMEEITSKFGVTVYEFPLEEQLKYANSVPDIPAMWVEKGEAKGLAAEKIMKTFLRLQTEAGHKWHREWLGG